MFWNLGWSHNLGSGGIFVRTLQIPSIGESLDVSFAMPGYPQPLELAVSVTWQKTFASRGIRSYPTGMGLCFANPTPEQQLAIDGMAAALTGKSGTVT
jgi:Tfp pilus assembly protein PilZ